MKQLTIKLSPHDAIILASFHQEFINDIIVHEECIALKIAINNFLEQIVHNMPEGGLEDAKAEIEVNILLGKSPDRPGRL